MQKMYLSVLLVLLLILVPYLIHRTIALCPRPRPRPRRRRLRVEVLLLRIAGKNTQQFCGHCIFMLPGEAEQTRKKDKGKIWGCGLLPVLLLVQVPFGAAHLCQATIRFYCPLSLSLSIFHSLWGYHDLPMQLVTVLDYIFNYIFNMFCKCLRTFDVILPIMISLNIVILI